MCNIKLLIDKNLSFEYNKKKLIHNFLKFCVSELSIQTDFCCKLVSNRESNNIKTTAFYSFFNKNVVVYSKNRMLGDILRSICHELVHHRQYEEDKIGSYVQDIGGDIEDEANSKAGAIVKAFIYNNKGNKLLFENKN